MTIAFVASTGLLNTASSRKNERISAAAITQGWISSVSSE